MAQLASGTLIDGFIAYHEGNTPSSNIQIGTLTVSNGVTSNGSFVINNNATTWSLQVNSSGSDAAISLNNTDTGGREYWLDSGGGTAGVGQGNLGIWDKTAGSLRWYIAPGGVMHAQFGSVLSSSSGQSVSTYNNTLDDGSGNVTVIGNVSMSGNSEITITNSSSSTNLTIDSNDIGFNRVNAPAYFYNIGSGGSLTFQTGSSRADALILGSNQAVTTANNTLDDGSGNITISGNTNLEGTFTVTGGSGRIHLSSVDGSNNMWLGTGIGSEPGNLAFGWQTNGNGVVTLVQLGSTANPLVRTNNNTLDDGSGQMAIDGNLNFNQNQGIGFVVDQSRPQPTSPTAGQLWYDNVKNQLLIYQGAQGWTQAGSSTSTIKTQTITASGSQTVFDLDFSYPVGQNAIEVYISGARQDENAYAESSSTSITFSAPVPSGTDVFVQAFISAPTLGNTPSVWRTQRYTSDGTTTTYNTTYNYSPGTNSLWIFFNGVHQQIIDDFTENSSGTSFSLVTAPISGTFIDAVYVQSSSVQMLTNFDNTVYISGTTPSLNLYNGNANWKTLISGTEYQVAYSSDGTSYSNFLEIDTNSAVKTQNNLLDDGSGNGYFAGHLTMQNNGAVLNLTNSTVNGHQDFTFTSMSGSIDMDQIVWSRNTQYNGAFQVYNNSNAKTLFLVNSNGSISTVNNTLDDGNGYTVVTGGMQVSGSSGLTLKPQQTATSSSSYDSIWLTLNSSVWNGTAAATATGSIYLDYAGRLSLDVAGTIALLIGTNQSITTKNNTLDDGSGNVTVSGNLSVDKPASFVGTSTMNDVGNGTWLGFYNSSGSRLGWIGTGGSTDTTITIDSANDILLNTGGSVSTANNTLDDGSGNVTITGNIDASTGYIHGHTNIGTLGYSNPTSEGASTQGIYFGWNYETGQGEGDVFVYGQGGQGGLNIYNTNQAANGTFTKVFGVDGSGNVTVEGNLTVNGTMPSSSASASGVWNPPNGTFNQAAGAVVNIASVPSGATGFSIGVYPGSSYPVVIVGASSPSNGTRAQAVETVGNTTEAMIATSTSATTGYYGGSGSTNNLYLVALHDGGWGIEGYFQINGGYLQFVCTNQGGTSSSSQDTIIWSVY